MTAPSETEVDGARGMLVEAPPLPCLRQVEQVARRPGPDWLANDRIRPLLRALLRALSAWPV
jgi:hypothetical protein